MDFKEYWYISISWNQRITYDFMLSDDSELQLPPENGEEESSNSNASEDTDDEKGIAERRSRGIEKKK